MLVGYFVHLGASELLYQGLGMYLALDPEGQTEKGIFRKGFASFQNVHMQQLRHRSLLSQLLLSCDNSIVRKHFGA